MCFFGNTNCRDFAALAENRGRNCTKSSFVGFFFFLCVIFFFLRGFPSEKNKNKKQKQLEKKKTTPKEAKSVGILELPSASHPVF